MGNKWNKKKKCTNSCSFLVGYNPLKEQPTFDCLMLTVTGPPVGPFALACLKQLYPILKLI